MAKQQETLEQKILALVEQGLEIHDTHGHAQRLEHTIKALEDIKKLVEKPSEKPVEEQK